MLIRPSVVRSLMVSRSISATAQSSINVNLQLGDDRSIVSDLETKLTHFSLRDSIYSRSKVTLRKSLSIFQTSKTLTLLLSTSS